jgi:hypothetical protein
VGGPVIGRGSLFGVVFAVRLQDVPVNVGEGELWFACPENPVTVEVDQVRYFGPERVIEGATVVMKVRGRHDAVRECREILEQMLAQSRDPGAPEPVVSWQRTLTVPPELWT